MRFLALLGFLLPTIGQSDTVERLLGDTTVTIVATSRIESDRRAELEEWVRSSAATVALVYGRFPSSDVRVVLRDSRWSPWSSDSAVYFGQVTRRGGGQVDLYINPRAPIDKYYDDWTASHEFSHLLLPLLDREDRWISEGFATYYQNVLMARSGRYSTDYAWQRLAAGFDRGRASRPDLAPNESGEAGARSARMKYYWAGAALAMLADIELRQRSGGSESLDTVLESLESCCLPAHSRWSGLELLEKLDSFLETPVFMPLYREHAMEPGFPDIAAAMHSTEFARIRANIMAQTADLTYQSE